MIYWKEEYALNLDIVDEQHIELFKIFDEIFELNQQLKKGYDKYDEIMQVIKNLLNYTIFHFSEEEKLWRDDYLDMASHKFQHKIFTAKIKNINIHDVDDNQEEILDQLIEELSKWLTVHILTIDKGYLNFLK